MPVLIVSLKTWPHDGFSRKRSTRPSSSVTTIPNSSGFSTDFSPIVTAAPCWQWKSTSCVRSMSQSASPEITSVEQLAGTKLATPQLGNTQDVALRAFLKESGFETDETGGGTHTVLLAAVASAAARGGAPLAYFRGRFGRLAM